MKISQPVILLIICLLLASCGGGTTASKSGNSVSIKMDFENGSSGRDSDGGFMVGSGYVSGVKITYGTSGAEYQELDVTSAAKNSSEVVIPDLFAGKTYTFSISAVDESDVIVCSGSTDVEIAPNATTEAELVCRFSGVQSLELAALNLIKASAEDGSTYERISGFVASDFGVMNGMNREEFIASLTDGADEFLFDDNIKPVNVVMVDTELTGKSSDITEGVYEIKIIYSDGSYEYDTAGFVKEDGEWKIKGNGRAHDMEIRHAASRYDSGDQETGSLTLTGYRVSLNSGSASDTTTGFTISGDGIGESAFTKFSDGTFGLVSPNMLTDTEYESAVMPVGEMASGMVPYEESPSGDAELTAVYSDSSAEQYTVKGTGLTVPQALYDFPHVELAVADSENYDVNITLPSAYPVSGVRVTIDAKWDGGSYHKEAKLSIVEPSFTISGLNEVLANNPSYFVIGVTAVDGDIREFTSYCSFSYLMIQAEAGLNGYLPFIGVFKGLGNGGFVAYQDVSAGIDTNRYSVQSYYSVGLADGQTLYNIMNVYGSPRYASDSYIQKMVISRLSQNEAPYAATLEFTGYGIYQNNPSINSMIKGSDGSVYIFSTFDGISQEKPGIVSVLKMNADADEILWLKDYHLEFTYPRSFFRGAVIVDNAGTDELVMVLLSDEYINTVLRINTETGNVIDAVKLSLPDADSFSMLLSGKLVYVPQANKFVLVGNLQEPHSNGYRNRICTVVLNSDFTISSSVFSEPLTAFPNVNSVGADNNGNIYLNSSSSAGEKVYRFNAVMDAGAQTYYIASISVQNLTFDSGAFPFGTDTGSSMTVSQDKAYVVYSINGYENSLNVYRNSGVLIVLDSDFSMETAVMIPEKSYISTVIAGGNGSVTLLGSNIIDIMQDITIGGKALTSAGAKIGMMPGSVAVDTSFYSPSAFTTSAASPIVTAHPATDTVLTGLSVNLYNLLASD